MARSQPRSKQLSKKTKVKSARTVRLSDDADYIAYGRSYSRGDYGEALRHLQQCLSRATHAKALDREGFLLGRIGHIHFCLGDSMSALRSFRLAECKAPRSLVAAAVYMRFLHDELGDFELAALEGQRILGLFDSGVMDEASRLVFEEDNLKKIRQLLMSARRHVPKP